MTADDSLNEDLRRQEQADLKAEYEMEVRESYYSDWLADNIAELRKDFCEEKEDEFNSFCKDIFHDECGRR